MKNLFSPVLTALLTLFVFVMMLSNLTSAQEDFKIVAVNEKVRTMEPGLFASANQEVVKKYISDGAPASMSSFVLFAGDDAVLFDAGLGGTDWVKKIDGLGIKPERVKLILLTHLHPDHIGGLLNGNARRFPVAKVRCAVLESAYWYPEGKNARSKQLASIKSVYGDDFSKTFEFDDTVFSNAAVKVKAINAAGHTPGHTAFLIESPQKKFLIIGDLLHAAALQFPQPEISSNYDMDSTAAAASRKRILDLAAKEGIPIGGMHLPPPTIGTVKTNGQGYDWIPW
jgi:glyoxylase-like metal-dependent hydrolase (beta-lactamase superfamily II)